MTSLMKMNRENDALVDFLCIIFTRCLLSSFSSSSSRLETCCSFLNELIELLNLSFSSTDCFSKFAFSRSISLRHSFSLRSSISSFCFNVPFNGILCLKSFSAAWNWFSSSKFSSFNCCAKFWILICLLNIPILLNYLFQFLNYLFHFFFFV